MRRVLAASLAMSMLVASALVQAVVQNVKLVDARGQPVANQTVTIVFPPGVTGPNGEKEAKEDTNEKGILWFDFPGDGKYLIRHPGGVLEWEVAAAGSPGFDVSPLAVGAAIAAVGVGLYVANDDDDDGGSSSDGGSSGGALAGNYNCPISQVRSNLDNHPTGSLAGGWSLEGSAGSSGSADHNSGGTNISASGSISSEGELSMGTTSATFEGRPGSTANISGPMSALEVIIRCTGCPDSNGNGNADPVHVLLNCARNSS